MRAIPYARAFSKMNEQPFRAGLISVSRRAQMAAMVVFAFSCMMYTVWAGQPRKHMQEYRPSAEAAPQTSVISAEQAVEIALAQAGGGTVATTEFRYKKDGRPMYKVLLVENDTRVKIEVDAQNGQVTKFERKNIESVKYSKTMPGPLANEEIAIDAAKAREIALGRTDGGTVVEVEKEYERDGRVVFELDIVKPGYKYEVKVDARSGAIVEYKEKAARYLGGA